jgi:Flp pilus assembly protein CpaB
VQDKDWKEDLKKYYKYYIFDKKLPAGQMLSTSYLIEREKAGLASKLREGFTAFALPVTPNSGVAGLIQPDDYVKVVSTKKMPSGEKLPKVLMQNIRVVAVDQMSEREPSTAGGPAPKVATTVTLEVTDEEAKTLRVAKDESPLDLSLIAFENVRKMMEEREKKHNELEEKFAGKEDDKSKKEKQSDLDIFVRQQRLGEQESTKPSKARIDDLLRPGYHAFGVKATPDSAAGGFILPGNRVNILGLKKLKNLKGEEKKHSFLLMKNIRVVTVDDITTEDKNVTQMLAKTINVEVTDAEGKKLQEAADEAELRLVVIGKADLAGKTEAELDADRGGESLDAEPAPPAPEAPQPVKKGFRAIQFISGSGSTVHLKNDDGLYSPGSPGQPAAPPTPQTIPNGRPNQ